VPLEAHSHPPKHPETHSNMASMSIKRPGLPFGRCRERPYSRGHSIRRWSSVRGRPAHMGRNVHFSSASKLHNNINRSAVRRSERF